MIRLALALAAIVALLVAYWQPVFSDYNDDADGDGFTNYQELYYGTSMTSACARLDALEGRQRAWPPDYNDDRQVDIINDLVAMTPFAFQGHLDSSETLRGIYKFDLNTDGSIDFIGDIVIEAGLFGQTCTGY